MRNTTPHWILNKKAWAELMVMQLKEIAMPHVIVKLWPGKSERQKTQLAEAIVQDVMSALAYGEESVSVAIEEVKSRDWAEKVYRPDIVDNWEKLYKKPGYTM